MGWSSRPRGLHVAVWLLALFLAAALNEWLARRTLASFDLENFNLRGEGNKLECVRPSRSRGYEPAPGTCGVDADGARVYRQHPEAKGSPTKVMFVGDSVTGQTGWPQALRGHLGAAWPTAPVEVHTYGVAGYNLCQELSMYREKVEAVAPHLVVLQVSGNDARQSPVLMHVGDEIRYFVGDEFVEFPRWVTYSRFLTLAAVTFLPKTAVADDPARDTYAQACLSALRDEVEKRNIQLLSVFFPLLWDPGQTPPVLAADELKVRSIHTDVAVKAFDLRPILEAAGPMATHRSVANDFMHPNAAAQLVIGEALSGWIAQQLPDPAGK